MLGCLSFRLLRIGCLALAAGLLPTVVCGADVFYDVPVQDLKFSEGKLPPDADFTRWTDWSMAGFTTPYVAMDGEGEAYLLMQDRSSPLQEPRASQTSLLVRVAAPRKISGQLFWPKSDGSGFEKLRFTLDREPKNDFKRHFLEAKQAHYGDLLDTASAGGAWFRHELRAARPALGQSDVAADNRPVPWRGRRVDSLQETFDLFSGGRAISDNLQLDRTLPRLAGQGDSVRLDSLTGISIAEIDWKPLIAGRQPTLDPLAALVPADQHVVLFPDFAAFLAVADRLADHGTVVMRLAAAQSQDRRLVERYTQQLGVSLQGLARLLGPQAVKSVALTGSDPYFASGTDVGLVFETAQPQVLKNLLVAQAALNAQQVADAEHVSGEVNGLAYAGLRSPDRRVSSYVAALAGAVVLTNSPYQLERFAAVAAKQAPAIASLDEFAFFRDRYPRGDAQESALVFLSDATIRRWCGPRWRIAASRETRDAAVLADLQAAAMDKLAHRLKQAGPLFTDLPLAAAGELTLTPYGVRSAAVGDLTFMTPIAELKFDEVTKQEADAYNQWRDGYQRNWRWAFDPIALRLSVAENRLAADLTVMPLIAGSEYRQFVELARGAEIKPDAGDRHDALLEIILAINSKSETMRGVGGLLVQMAPGARLDPLGWLGQSVAVYVDDDPFWQDLAACDQAKRSQFFEKNIDRLPVALWAEVADGFKLTAFLVSLRAFIEQTSPGMTKWETLEYREQPYVRVTPSPRAMPPGGEKAQLLYAASGKFLLLTPNEALLKRALDRQAVQEAPAPNAAAPAKDGQPGTRPAAEKDSPGLRPWLGSSLDVQFDRKLPLLLSAAFSDFYQRSMQSKAWSNLPILNEWHQRYPDQDPVALHERIWKERLVCPGGGKYVWNDAWQTMESTVYGCPAQPQKGPAAPAELLRLAFANFGLTFEKEGLRAAITLERTAAPPENKP